ncbi:MAG: hypothetical protein ACRENG_34475, partial [bacterium]
MKKISRTLKMAACVLLLMAFGQSALFAQTFSQWGDLKPGAHAVGFKTEHKYDYSRTYKPKHDYDGKPVLEERARP